MLQINKKRYDGLKGGVYTLINSLADFKDFIKEAKLQRYIAFDSETNGLNWVFHMPCGLSIGWGAGHNYYIPINHKTDEKQLKIEDIREDLQDLFGDPNKVFIGHHGKFDRHMYKNIGIEIKGTIHDTMNMAKVVNENGSHGLKDLSNKIIHPEADKWEDIIKQWRTDEAKRRRKEYAKQLKEYTNEETTKLTSNQLFINEDMMKSLSIQGALLAKIRLEEELCHKNKVDDVTYDYIPLDLMTPYACSDVHYTYLLYKHFLYLITQDEGLKSIYLNEVLLDTELFLTERSGIKLDRPYLEKTSLELEDQLQGNKVDIFKSFGREFSIDSPKQLMEALKEKGVTFTKLSKKSKALLEKGITSGLNFSIDKDVLEELAKENEYARSILDYRKAVKNKTTYVDGMLQLLDKEDYLHTSYNAMVISGRLSGHAPNTMNISANDKTVKKAFIKPSDEYNLIYMDLSQVELRLTAHHSQDSVLLECYPWEGKGKDVHLITAAEIVLGISVEELLSYKGKKAGHREGDLSCDCKNCVFNNARFVAKRVNFGIIYGVGPRGLQKQIPTPKTVDECDAYIKGYLSHYRGVNKWIKSVKDTLKKQEYVVNSFGRQRRFPGYKMMDFKDQGRAERQSVNFLVQSDCADLFKKSIVKIGQFLRANKAKTRMINFVHDDIQFYWHKDEMELLPQVKRMMEEYPFEVPIVAEVSISETTWADKQDMKIELPMIDSKYKF